MNRSWIAKNARMSGIYAIIGGVLCVVIKYLINHQPPPFSYDDYNRMLLLPLLMLSIGYTGLRPILRSLPGKLPKAAYAAGMAGFVLLAAGNVLEFWFVLLQSAPNAYAAYRTGSDQVWWGSYWGWDLFLAGLLSLLIAAILTAIVAYRDKQKKMWLLVFAGFGIVEVLLFGLEGLIAPFGTAWTMIG